MKNDIDLAKVSNKVLDILKEFRLNPVAFEVSIALEKNEFERVAEKHPDHLMPAMIIKTGKEEHGIQWSVQILRQMIVENSPDN